ncbi:hypothetical protein [Archangium minus]|uniref:hypothetical protein n=1 Tax=Archangium minus TaxID=83450 RepID=UPI0037BF844C
MRRFPTWADEVARDLGAIHIVINNAGISLGATIEDTRYEDFEWLMGINYPDTSSRQSQQAQAPAAP